MSICTSLLEHGVGLCGAISLVAGFLKWQRHVESHYNLKIGVLAYGSTADFFFFFICMDAYIVDT